MLPRRGRILTQEPACHPALSALVLDLAPARAGGLVTLRLGHALPLLERDVVGTAVVLQAARIVGNAAIASLSAEGAMRIFSASLDRTPVTAQKSGPSAVCARVGRDVPSSSVSVHTDVRRDGQACDNLIVARVRFSRDGCGQRTRQKSPVQERRTGGTRGKNPRLDGPGRVPMARNIRAIAAGPWSSVAKS